MAAPAGEALLERVAELWIEARELIGAAHALAIGRIHHHHAARCGCRALKHITALELHPALDAGFRKIASGRVQRFGIGITSVQAGRMLRAASFVPYTFPKRRIEGGQLLEAEATR